MAGSHLEYVFVEDSMESTGLVSDEIYNDLFMKINSGIWKIGDKIPSENQIAKERNISRVSVRTAIHKLQAQGMIITKPGKGSFVAKNQEDINASQFSAYTLDLSAEDYRHMIELRRALEFTSIDLVCKNGSEQDIERLRKALFAIQHASNDKEYIDADFNFHYSIILGSHNPVFIHIYDLCRDILYKYFTELFGDNRDNNWENAKQRHLEIFTAIETRDAKTAIQIIENTFEFNRNRLARFFKNENRIV